MDTESKTTAVHQKNDDSNTSNKRLLLVAAIIVGLICLATLVMFIKSSDGDKNTATVPSTIIAPATTVEAPLPKGYEIDLSGCDEEAWYFNGETGWNATFEKCAKMNLKY